MKRIMEVWRRTEELVEIEVTLPIYRKHDLSDRAENVVIYSRFDLHTDGTLVCHSIHLHGLAQIEVRVEFINPVRDRSSVDYSLGRGEYASTEAEFLKALEAARQLLGEFSGLFGVKT